ncbi:glycosyltransferase family 4 protein [Nostoc sp. UHCC 0870]|uniref:glycosyltransferase family 4 protein n=1 Tax=Nostoc sp. UHCC 0870 TaxID=2914041 RepID=UPI001EDFBC93|nr:glycosyltransferase family 4 protein [Nostoc sp. UHCC 0870]UKO98444.1 glycosyltransferase family 4 protein [Nostoc sp. UHCC 0870]
MKINILMSSYVKNPGGSHRVAYEYANYLATTSHQVKLIYPEKLSRFASNKSYFSFWKRSIHKIQRTISGNEINWFKFNSNVEKLFVPDLTQNYIPDADIVIATAWQVAEYMGEYSEAKGIKMYIIHHDESLSGYPIERVRETWHLPVNKVAVSRWTYESIQQATKESITYIPNGINHNLYRIIEPIENRDLCVCMAYSPRAIKDAKTGLKALSIAKERFPKLSAKLFGVFPKDSSIPDWAVYYRNRPDSFLVKEIYNRSAIFICSSIYEGFGLPVAEAMGCGCAVVTTDCGGITDFALHNKTALISPAKNATTLAENLCFLLEDAELRIKLAYTAKDNIKNFSWDSSCKQLEILIHNSMEGNK